MRKKFYLSTGQVTVSDWLVRQFFRLSTKSCTDQRRTTSFAKTSTIIKQSQLLHATGYYYLLPQMHMNITVFVLGFKKNGVLWPREFLKTGVLVKQKRCPECLQFLILRKNQLQYLQVPFEDVGLWAETIVATGSLMSDSLTGYF